MTRRAVALDRAASLLLGVGLLALGCSLVAWHQKAIAPQLRLAQYVGTSWWPWACAGAGVTLVALGCRWVAAHRWPPKASRVALADGKQDLTADATSAAAAAAVALGREAGIVKANGSATIERGRPTVTLTAVVPARRGVRAGIAAADRTARIVSLMLGDDVAVRTVLRVDPKRGTVVR